MTDHLRFHADAPPPASDDDWDDVSPDAEPW
jgi:hypothetical protein